MLDCGEETRNVWRFVVECGVHNHELPPSLEGHEYAERLTREELQMVRRRTSKTENNTSQITRFVKAFAKV